MVRRIKILYTIPNFDTAGSGKVVYDLVKHIDKKRFEPHICCMHNRGDYFKTVQKLGVPIHIFQFATPYRPFFSFLYRVLKIARFFKKQQFDLIHSWHWSSDVSEPLAAKLAAIPFVYTKKAMGWGNKTWRWRSQLSAKIVTINSDMKKHFFNTMQNKVIDIPIGLDYNDFQIVEKKRRIDDYIFLDSDIVIISVANLVPVKGIELLLDAVKILENNKIKTLIVGDNTSVYAKQLMKTYKSDNVIFTGKKLDVSPYLSVSDMFVICTKPIGEGQPMAPIEAMTSGCIVIGSKVPGVKDVLHFFQELLFQPNDAEDLALKIKKVIDLPVDERVEIAKKMKDFAKNEYDLERSVKAHESLYINLLIKAKSVF